MTPEQWTALLQIGQNLTVAGLLLVALVAGGRGWWYFGHAYREQNNDLQQQIGELKARISALEEQHAREAAEWKQRLDELHTENVQLAADLRVAHIELATLRARIVSGAGTA